MPPKRRAPAASAAPTPRASKLAKQNNINGSQESEIKEAFALFQSPDSTPKDPFMPTGAVKRGLAALNLGIGAPELRELLDAADPENEGIVSYEAFLGVAALCMNMQEGDGEDEDEGEDVPMGGADHYADVGAKSKAKGKGKAKVTAKGTQRDEIEHAFRLFTGANTKAGQAHAEPGMITAPMLRRVARELKEDVDDEMLRNMIREASGGNKGVSLQDFEGVMRRAGVFR